MHTCDIARRKAAALSNHHTCGYGAEYFQRRLPVLGERCAGVVHDRPVVVASQVVAVGDVLAEVVFAPFQDVFPAHAHETVTVLPALLMPQPYGMTDFVDRVAQGASATQGDVLSASAHAHIRGATRTGHEADVVRIRGCIGGRARNEANSCLRLPVGNGVGDTALVGQGGIDLKRHGRVGPAFAGVADANRKGEHAAVVVHVRYGAEDDIALENGIAVHVGVNNCFVGKCVAVDQGSASGGTRHAFTVVANGAVATVAAGAE